MSGSSSREGHTNSHTVNLMPRISSNVVTFTALNHKVKDINQWSFHNPMTDGVFWSLTQYATRHLVQSLILSQTDYYSVDFGHFIGVLK